MIKPDHVKYADEILNLLDQYGTRIIHREVSVPKEIIENHYSVHKGKPFYQRLINSFLDKNVVIAVYEGENITNKFREVIGATEPSKADRNSIRGKYSNDTIAKAVAENRSLRNVIHASDSSNEAEREIEVWNSYL